MKKVVSYFIKTDIEMSQKNMYIDYLYDLMIDNDNIIIFNYLLEQSGKHIDYSELSILFNISKSKINKIIIYFVGLGVIRFFKSIDNNKKVIDELIINEAHKWRMRLDPRSFEQKYQNIFKTDLSVSFLDDEKLENMISKIVQKIIENNYYKINEKKCENNDEKKCGKNDVFLEKNVEKNQPVEGTPLVTNTDQDTAVQCRSSVMVSKDFENSFSSSGSFSNNEQEEYSSTDKPHKEDTPIDIISCNTNELNLPELKNNSMVPELNQKQIPTYNSIQQNGSNLKENGPVDTDTAKFKKSSPSGDLVPKKNIIEFYGSEVEKPRLISILRKWKSNLPKNPPWETRKEQLDSLICTISEYGYKIDDLTKSFREEALSPWINKKTSEFAKKATNDDYELSLLQLEPAIEIKSPTQDVSISIKKEKTEKEKRKAEYNRKMKEIQDWGDDIDEMMSWAEERLYTNFLDENGEMTND